MNMKNAQKMEFISFVFTEIWEKTVGNENIPPGWIGLNYTLSENIEGKGNL